MSTPTDPYTTAVPQPHEPAEALTPPNGATPNAPETFVTASPTSPDSADPNLSSDVAYDESDALAWDNAFQATDEAAQAPEPAMIPAAHGSELGEINFDDIPHGHTDEAAPIEAASALAPDSAEQAAAAHSGDAAAPARMLSNAEPLAQGATFASAYSATGVTELPKAAEMAASAANSTAESAVPSAPIRESVLPHGSDQAASAAPAEEASPEHVEWKKDPGTDELIDLPDEPESRVGAHIGSIFATLLLIPIVWYLLSDAGVRLSLVENNPWSTGHVHIGALIELLGGMVMLTLLWLMARASSLGAQLWGALLTIAGAAAIVVPQLGKAVIEKMDSAIGDLSILTGNVVHHLNLDLASGRIAIFGLLIFLTGLMIHLSRKSASKRAVAKALREKALG